MRYIEQEIRRNGARTVNVQEKIICLSEEESAFISLETHRLLLAQKHNRNKEIPLVAPGQTAYAVYM